ncbi:MAG: hypothetical protein JEZ08_12340 [Clostridiales bacterium]|nr:hypothetical protein [Clostridiales bacterium]
MDWKRIKSILIMALIVINGLLGWTLYQENRDPKTDTIDRAQIISLLEDKLVTIDPDLIETNTDIDNITLAIQTYDEDFVKSVFDNHNDYEDKDIYSTLMNTTQNNEMIYETDYKVLVPTYLSDEVILQQAYELIEELNIGIDDVYVKDIGHTGKKTIIEFGQKHNGFVIRDAYMIIKYNNENLLSFKRAWYDVVDTNKTQNIFLSQEYALYEFIGKLYNRFPNRERALEIESFQLVYQLRIETGTLDYNELAEKGDPSIYWEIVTSDEESYLIEANRD